MTDSGPWSTLEALKLLSIPLCFAPRLARGLAAVLLAGSLLPLAYASQAVLHNIPGTQTSATMGNALALGDVNADGTADWIVGIRNGKSGSLTTGLVRVYSGITGTLLFELAGTQGSSAFGFAVDLAGDVNGDGFGDILVGAPFHQEALEVQNGRAFVFSGANGALLHQFGGPSFFDSAGFAVAGVGDVNGDSFDDVAVGMPGADLGGTDRGLCMVFSGLDGSTLHFIGGTTDGDLVGSSVAALGDLDVDGFADFAIGARNRDGSQVNAGSVCVYSGFLGALLYERFGSAPSQSMGYSLAHIGDVDGDGKTDWITGSAQDPRAGAGAGSFQVYSGAAGVLLYDQLGSAPSEHLGETVAAAGDVDGDGVADWLVSAPFDSVIASSAGRVEVYSGSNGEVLCTLFGEASLDRFGLGVAGAGDFNGDGIPDLLVGIPGSDAGGTLSGEVRVYAGCRPQGVVYCSPANLNSTGVPATIRALGSNLVADNQLVLVGENVPPGKFGYFLLGSAMGFLPLPAGSQGNLCLGGSIGRYNLPNQILQANSAGSFQLTLNLLHLPLAGSPPVLAGQTWQFQAWYRDLNPGQTSNFTNAVSVLFP